MPASLSHLQNDLNLGLSSIKELWNYYTKDWVTSVYAADINQDGDIEVMAGARDGRVYLVTREGQPIWDKIIGNKTWISSVTGLSNPLSGQSPRIFTASRDGKIYAMDKDGKVLTRPTPQVSSTDLSPASQNHNVWFNTNSLFPILQLHAPPGSSSYVTFGSEDRAAYALDAATGTLHWRFQTGGRVRAIFTCDIDGDGRLETLVGSQDQYLYVLDPSGKQLAKRFMGHPIYSIFAADVDQDGKIEILIGTRAKNLLALTPDLREKWSRQVSNRIIALTVVDVNNDNRLEILASSDDKYLCILNDEGKIIWRYNYGARIYSLYALDLDHDGHIEVLVGTEANRISCLRIQLSKDIDKKIARSYAALGKPIPETLSHLTSNQRDLLLDILGSSKRPFDPTLHEKQASAFMAEGKYTNALNSLLRLEDQKVQFLWERGQIGYLNTLCFGDTSGNGSDGVIVGTLDGTVLAFNATGRLLWSIKLPDQQIDDVQAAYLSSNRAMDVLVRTASGELVLLRAGRRREVFAPPYAGQISCFYVLTSPDRQSPEIFLGTEKGQMSFYNKDFQPQTLTLTLPADVQLIFALTSLTGQYSSPEILAASSHQIYAYTRGGNQLWSFDAFGRVMALCAKDLDGDGHLEILIGSEDRNLYVLDYQGKLRWRYYFLHTVSTLDAADLNGDGSMEVLAGCADGLLAIFNVTGDLIWRYNARDRIQGLRVGDIDQDGHMEIALISEDHLEVLQVIDQNKLSALIATCWEHILADHSAFEVLFNLIQDPDPYLRAGALLKLSELQLLPEQVFDLFRDATAPATLVSVRKVLPAAIMRAYPANPAIARDLLNQLYVDPSRDVRIEVVENLLLLVDYDWDVIITYLERASGSSDRSTQRAAIRKISHLVDKSDKLQADRLFALLLDVAEDRQYRWIRQEAGSAIARLLNRYSSNILVCLYQLLERPIHASTLRHIAYNLADPQIQQVFSTLLDLSLNTDNTDAFALLSTAVPLLQSVSEFPLGAEIWLMLEEARNLFLKDSLPELSTYEPHLAFSQFQSKNTSFGIFLHFIEHLSSITRTLKIYLRRDDLNDRLNSLLDGMNGLDSLQDLIEHEYGLSPLPGSPQPRLPEFPVLKILMARWQKMFRAQLNELRGHAELDYELRSRQVHFEETVGIWLAITNRGRSSANNVKVTLLSSDTFEVLRASFETEAIFSKQEMVGEFLIKPLTTSPVALNFEIAYDDPEEGLKTVPFHERLDFIERQREFTSIDNPYSTGTPAGSSMCYGRDAELAYLQSKLARTSAQTVLVLYGQRRSGKTTLLFQLTQTSLLADHVPVLIDMQNLAYNLDLCSFLFKIAHTIAQSMGKKDLLIPRPERAEFAPDPPFAFDCFLDEVETRLCGRKLILLLDEFEVLEVQVNLGKLTPEIFQYLRSLMQHRQYMHFLLSGTHHIEQLTRDYWSFFFNIALHYRLPGKIAPAGASALITEPVAQFLEYEPLAVTKVRQLTADQPYLIHLVCRSLVDHCNQQRKNYVSINDVNLVLRDVMDIGAIHFDWIWNQIVPSERVLLAAIAEGCRDEGRVLSLRDIKGIYQKYHIPYQHSDVMSSLKTLWAADVIETDEAVHPDNVFDDAHYHVSIDLLRQWLRRIQPLDLL